MAYRHRAALLVEIHSLHLHPVLFVLLTPIVLARCLSVTKVYVLCAATVRIAQMALMVRNSIDIGHNNDG